MEANNNIIKFFEGKTILITGSTGFLAKIMVEKILRIQPNIKKLFLLIRPTSARSSTERLYQEIIGTELFKVAKEKHGARFNSLISEKVACVSGDVSCENLGIQDSQLRDQMWRSIEIIVNSAATTKFDERYDVAMGINVLGALHLLKFAKKCVNIKVLLHVSTAYVCGEAAGLILEKPFRMGETLLSGSSSSYLDIDLEKKLALERLRQLEDDNASPKEIRSSMKDFGIQRAKKHGWPNTYVFTKAMGEMILGHFKEDVNVVIIRPTIVSSTFKEPFPGWVEGVRTLDSLLVAYGKGKLKCFIGDPNSVQDLIPGDMVVNCMLVSIVAHAHQSLDHHIYHVGSSHRNPLKYEDIRDLFYCYFSKNPWVNDHGKPVRVKKIRRLSDMDSFQNHIATRYLPLLKVLRIVNILSCHHFESTYVNSKRKINSLAYLAQLYGCYMFFHGTFDDSNTEELQMQARENNGDNQMFEFDPTIIRWKDYFMNIHFPGAVKYLF